MEDRSLGSVDEKVERRLKTVDSKSSDQQEEQEGEVMLPTLLLRPPLKINKFAHN